MAKDVASGPKAVNIVRPPQHHQRPPPQPPSPSAYSNASSYFSAQRKPRVAQAAQIDISRNPSTNYSYSTSTVSSASTNATNFSATSNANARVPPTIFSSVNASAAFTLFQPSMISYNQHQPTLGHRQSTIFSPQRSRSNSVHSRPGTVASEPETESESEEIDGMDDHNNLDDDDQSTASESEHSDEDEDDYEDDSDLMSKVVAKIKNGTIMNGRGEFVNKTMQEPENEWREEARINRKVKRTSCSIYVKSVWSNLPISPSQIADLEISNTSLLAINATLEGKLRRQAKTIEDLRRQLLR